MKVGTTLRTLSTADSHPHVNSGSRVSRDLATLTSTELYLSLSASLLVLPFGTVPTSNP